MKSCMTCGMPLEGEHEQDIGMKIAGGYICQYDIEGGQVKSAEDIFEGGVQYFMDVVTEGDRELAERLTRTNMNSLPFWQEHHFDELDGPCASDEEFEEAMNQL